MMRRVLFSLLKKDIRLMLSSKFLLLAAGSLILYSCYINFVFVNTDQDIYPVYLYDPHNTQETVSENVVMAAGMDELKEACADGYAVGIDASGGSPEIYMVSSGVYSTDNYRAAWALSRLSPEHEKRADLIGTDSKEMKNRREITAEVLFFELAAVGFLGLASMLFKEKQMGVIRVHGILPVSTAAFILSKLCIFLMSDLVFVIFLTLVNLGAQEGTAVLPAVLVQSGILSLIMALVGFLCAVRLPDFKQFSLLYLVLAVFITTPEFLAGQTGAARSLIRYHPMYHMFMAVKNAYFLVPSASGIYYFSCAAAVVLLYCLVHRALVHEMVKEG